MLPGHSPYNPTQTGQRNQRWCGFDTSHLMFHQEAASTQNGFLHQLPWDNNSSNSQRIPPGDTAFTPNLFKTNNEEVRWHPDFSYQFPFSQSQFPSTSYTTNVFPSTSEAARKVDGGLCYQSALMPPYQAATTEYVNSINAPNLSAQWRLPLIPHGCSFPPPTSNYCENLQKEAQPFRTGPGTNNVRVRTSEKYRNVYTEQQRLELEKEYRMSTFINALRKSELSVQLHLTERQVKIWFQNRRAKDRREQKKTRDLQRNKKYNNRQLM